jgi:hypothetical protein
MNRAKTAEAEVAPLKNRQGELEASNQTLLGEQVEALLDAHGVKEEKIRNRAKSSILTLKNRDERVAWLNDFGFKPLDGKKESGNRVMNRGEGKTPKNGETPGEDNAEANAREAAVLIEEYKVTNRCSTEHATNVIRNRKPELFGIAARN